MAWHRAHVLIGAAPGMPVLAWPAAIAIWGPGSAADTHAHHAMHLVIAVRGELRVRVGDGAARTAAAVVIAADEPHAIDARGAEVVIGFIDPESALGLGLRGAMAETVRWLDDAEVAPWRAALSSPAGITAAVVDAWLRSAFPGAAQPARIHPRVRRVLRHLRTAPLAREDVALEALATVAGLSPTRLLHVFTESVGVPIRPYVRWLRVQRAAAALAGGAAITDAAHRAGFSDAAHLTRTFRSVFGMTPSEIVRHSLSGQTRAFDET
jgi:AraC-like DNA-binding protein